MAKVKINKITCCYGHPCFISIDNIDGKDVLKLDFKIKTFKVLNQGWKELPFPDNIIINDKLYLDEKMKDQLINALDVFINTGYLNNHYKKTERGFSYNEWTDVKGNKIHIQDSSVATDAYIWFGGTVENVFIPTENGLEKYKFPEGDLLIEDRMHLNITKVKKLKEIIQKQWIMNEVKNLDKELPVNLKAKNKNKI
jgi:hypothetical protein